MLSVKIKKFTIEKAAEVAQLIANNLVKVNSKDYSQRVINNLCELYIPENIKAMAEDKDFYVAVNEDKIAGIAGLEANTVYTVFVKPEYHGRGIGKKLMEQVEKLAREKGYTKVKVPASITAYKFYQNLGYERVREVVDDKFGKNIVMNKKI